MSAIRINTSEIDRRRFLQGTLAALPPLCCVSRVAPDEALSIREGRLHVDLARVPELRKRATSYAIVDTGHRLNLLLVHSGGGEWIAMNRACTHGGAMCTYNAKRESVQCTSLNHAEYDLRGTLLHGRTHGNLRTYPVRATRDAVEIEIGAFA